jgi:hypothetical protein
VLPSAHFAVALLPAAAYVAVRDRRLPTLRFGAVVFLGSQFPDLVDKPLAHQFGVLPSGRVFMHSLPTALPVMIAVALYGRRTDRPRVAGAFVFAHLSHLLADNYRPLLERPPRIRSDLLWPLVRPVDRPVVPHWAGEGGINVALWTVFSVAVLSVTAFLLVTDVRERFDR